MAHGSLVQAGPGGKPFLAYGVAGHFEGIACGSPQEKIFSTSISS
jgi:hypothetical protein